MAHKKNRYTHIAQEELMGALGVAFQRVHDNVYGDNRSDEEKNALIAEMSKQMARIEKLFGYVEYTCQRGI